MTKEAVADDHGDKDGNFRGSTTSVDSVKSLYTSQNSLHVQSDGLEYFSLNLLTFIC